MMGPAWTGEDLNRRGSHARHDDGQRHRQLPLREDLRRVHANSGRCLEHVWATCRIPA